MSVHLVQNYGVKVASISSNLPNRKNIKEIEEKLEKKAYSKEELELLALELISELNNRPYHISYQASVDEESLDYAHMMSELLNTKHDRTLTVELDKGETMSFKVEKVEFAYQSDKK